MRPADAPTELPSDPRRVDDLLVRYWDDGLTGDEHDELNRRLTADPDALAQLEAFCVQTVLAAAGPPAPRPRRWVYLAPAAALAASVAAAVVLAWPADPAAPVVEVARVVRSVGTVRVSDAGGESPGVPDTGFGGGATVSALGFGASAQIEFPDGTAVALAGDTVATFGGPSGRQVIVRRGTVSADVADAPPDGPLLIATPEARTRPHGRAAVVVNRRGERTEVGVNRGRVRVTAPAGDRPTDVEAGEVATCSAGGDVEKRDYPDTPGGYSWDLSRPPPFGWEAGRWEPDARPAAVRAAPWFDPFVSRSQVQIRSDNSWVFGHFALAPGSRVRARYKLDRPGTAQFLVVARPGPGAGPGCAVLQVPWSPEAARPGVWETVEVRASDLVPEGPPAFAPPWVGFLVVFNTYEVDLGLRVAEFSVIPPEAPAREP